MKKILIAFAAAVAFAPASASGHTLSNSAAQTWTGNYIVRVCGYGGGLTCTDPFYHPPRAYARDGHRVLVGGAYLEYDVFPVPGPRICDYTTQVRHDTAIVYFKSQTPFGVNCHPGFWIGT
jgi:hypothetical protein